MSHNNASIATTEVVQAGSCQTSHSLFVSVVGLAAILGLTAGVLFLISPEPGLDFIVLGAALTAISGNARRLAALLAVVLFVGAYPPWAWPTYWFYLTPLVAIWRCRDAERTLSRDVVESFAIGFAIAWMLTGFTRDGISGYAIPLHGLSCAVFAAPFVGIALSFRWTMNRSAIVSSAVAAGIAMACEFLQSSFGEAWMVTNLSLPAAAAPIAQWSYYVGPIGVAGLLYFCNMLWFPDWTSPGFGRWLPSATALGLACLAWAGGVLVAAQVDRSPLPFSAMLVQAHLRPGDELDSRPWIVLDQLTRCELERAGPVDLVIWPETAVTPSRIDRGHSEPQPISLRLTIHDLVDQLLPVYRCAVLTGAMLSKVGSTTKYGLEVLEVRSYNCACLLSQSGSIAWHEKLVLVPLKEGLPRWLETRWIRLNVLPLFKVQAPLTRGDDFRLLEFETCGGTPIRIAASICYESYLPWLPQFRQSHDADAIVHMTYDGHFAHHDGYPLIQQWVCQYRAIETRKWNLLCASFAGSAIIDPAGRIVARLGSEPGTLCTTRLH